MLQHQQDHAILEKVLTNVETAMLFVSKDYPTCAADSEACHQLTISVVRLIWVCRLTA